MRRLYNCPNPSNVIPKDPVLLKELFSIDTLNGKTLSVVKKQVSRKFADAKIKYVSYKLNNARNVSVAPFVVRIKYDRSDKIK